ncbi:shikimate kinase [Microbacterium pseudoresistens]|uniref:Shikimate kinase n=1 Tax=Microbacterium pseudoresistens TaxID=640634 RepID=A0A7Y9EWZ0_9MICO|nr:shikimate kinase [Microbacterium pseudoresistens]NYD55483.1 shikimate kinase [Microbacterium pseudoresistens]
MSWAENLTASEPVLVLVGPMGSGKSSVGRRVARELELTFADTDKAIAAAHGPISEIFAEHGEERFREWEREAVAEAIAAGGVVSVGGGAVVTAETRSLLREVPVVLLTVSAEAVAERITNSERPLLLGDGAESPVQRWERIMHERRAWYEEVADATFDTSRMPMSHIARDIAEWMRGRA